MSEFRHVASIRDNESNFIAFGAKRTFSGPRFQNRIDEYAP